MRQLLFLVICCFTISAQAQDCKSNANSKARVVGTTCQDTTYAGCFRKITGLRAIDDQFTVVSYIVRLDGAGFDMQVEILNTGADLNEAKKLIKYFRPGTFIEFSCIKAKDKNEKNYTLQPLVFYLK